MAENNLLFQIDLTPKQAGLVLTFHQIGPLGRFGQEVAMSVRCGPLFM